MEPINDYYFENFVVKILTLEDAEKSGYPFLVTILEENPDLSGRYVIVHSPEPNTYVIDYKHKYAYFDYMGYPDTKMSIEEAKEKMPYLFI